MSERTQGLLAAVPAEPRGDGPAWLKGLRQEAATALHERGFPGKKHESWRFTSVRDVVGTTYETASLEAVSPETASADAWVQQTLGDDGTFRVVLTEGRFTGAEGVPAGVSVRSLAEVLREEPALVEPVLGKLAPTEHFAALSSALFEDGAVVVVEKNAVVETPIHLVHVASPGASPKASYPRVVVIAREGSQAKVVESFLTREGDEKHLTNTVCEVQVGANARLEHVRITEGTEQALQLAYLSVGLDRDAFYGSRVVTLGGGLSRLELTARFDGPGSEVSLDGVYHVGGAEHVDHQVRVEHAAGHCTSHVRYRGLLDGRGHAVFNAMGIVKKDAQQSAAHQENRNLLLSDDATIDTKPHLEIDADDITASHGATIGTVDESSLFYMRSRGIPETQARDILTFAFVRELIDRVAHAPLVKRASDRVLDRLPHGDAIRELTE
ncbi:MAG: Fe-S cluster assembly protein SufD [Sandaracinaceae bacterium]